jgi:hypothetical protein
MAHPAHTRLIVRPEGHELLLNGWAQAETRQAKRDRRRRMTVLEGSFGQAAQNIISNGRGIVGCGGRTSRII